MSRVVTLQFLFEDDELPVPEKELEDWVFGEICQNLDFGFLTTCRVDDVD